MDAARYTLRTARNLQHFARVDELYGELPQGAKIGNPEGLCGDRPVFFEGRKPFAWIETHACVRAR